MPEITPLSFCVFYFWLIELVVLVVPASMLIGHLIFGGHPKPTNARK